MTSSDLRYLDDAPEPDEYAALFDTTGWNETYGCTPAELGRVLAASWSIVTVRDGDELVGCGRVMSDGVLYAMLFDVIVAPDHQRRGIGSEIVRRLLEKTDAAGIRDVLLFSARGAAAFYGRFGFVPRPLDAPGMIRRRSR